MKIHYWFHTHNNITFNPCFGYTPNFNRRDLSFTCSLLKIKPIAFMLVDYKDTKVKLPLPLLESDNENYFSIRYDKKYFLHFDYPINVNRNGMLLLASEKFYYASTKEI